MNNGGIKPEYSDCDEHSLTPYELFMWGPYYPDSGKLRQAATGEAERVDVLNDHLRSKSGPLIRPR